MRVAGGGLPRHGTAVLCPACTWRQDVTEFPAGIGHKLRPAERYIRATRRITKEGVEYPHGN